MTATTEARPSKPRVLGHFELIEQLGFGHFGTVWKAKDTILDRFVAIKIPRKEMLNESDVNSFFREARAAAQLHHPYIVGVHEVGREGQTVFIASDYVEGATLKDWLVCRPIPPKEAAELCANIANALHEAHEAGVVHRDVKPGNIMMDMNGKPHIMDFGIAKRETGELTITMEGALLGTPAYMSPEQAAGRGHEADRRSDVYSLGVILFEMLTGELPFRGEKRMLTMQIQRDEPPSPRLLNSKVPRDVETICLKCLEKLPGQRYQTAAELGKDLTCYVKGDPISARPIPGPVKLYRLWYRYARQVSGAITLLFAFNMGFGVLLLFPQRIAAFRTEGGLASLIFHIFTFFVAVAGASMGWGILRSERVATRTAIFLYFVLIVVFAALVVRSLHSMILVTTLLVPLLLCLVALISVVLASYDRDDSEYG